MKILILGGSLYPKSALQSGIDMPALVKRFAGVVKRDYGL